MKTSEASPRTPSPVDRILRVALLETRSLWRVLGLPLLAALAGFALLVELQEPDLTPSVRHALGFAWRSVRVVALVLIVSLPALILIRGTGSDLNARNAARANLGRMLGVFVFGSVAVVLPLLLYSVYRNIAESDRVPFFWAAWAEPTALLALVAASTPGLLALRARGFSSVVVIAAWAILVSAAAGAFASIGLPWPVDRVPGPAFGSEDQSEFRALAVACLATVSAAACSLTLERSAVPGEG